MVCACKTKTYEVGRDATELQHGAKSALLLQILLQIAGSGLSSPGSVLRVPVDGKLDRTASRMSGSLSVTQVQSPSRLFNVLRLTDAPQRVRHAPWALK